MEKQEIISAATEMYLQYGVKSVTMDDITHELGISKKTLYQIVDNKDELVYRSIQNYFEKEKEFVRDTFSDKSNAIEDLFQLREFLANYMTEVNPTVKYDLQKYHPEAWELFESYKNDFVFNVISDNIKKGIRQGIYREDVDVPVITGLYVGRLEILIDPEIFPPEDYSLMEVMDTMLAYHIRGIATRFGIQYLEYKLQNLEASETD